MSQARELGTCAARQARELGVCVARPSCPRTRLSLLAAARPQQATWENALETTRRRIPLAPRRVSVDRPEDYQV